jgi:hypothetical protein
MDFLVYWLTPIGGELYGDGDRALLYTRDGENNNLHLIWQALG